MYLAEASCNAEAITGFMQRRFPSTYLKVSFASCPKSLRGLGVEQDKDYVYILYGSGNTLMDWLDY